MRSSSSGTSPRPYPSVASTMSGASRSSRRSRRLPSRNSAPASAAAAASRRTSRAGWTAPSRGVEDRAVERPAQVLGQVAAVTPLGVEAVLAERVELLADVVALLLVGREPQAALAAQRVAGELLEAVEGVLGPPPEQQRPLRPVGIARDVVARGAAAEGEPAVPPARALGHVRALVEHAHAPPRAGERERTGAAGDAGADDLDLRRPVEPPLGERDLRVGEPVRRLHVVAMLLRDRHHPPVHAVALRGESGELELGQRGSGCPRRQPCRADELVGARRAGFERRQQRRGCVAELDRRRRAPARSRAPRARRRDRSAASRPAGGARSSRARGRS